jgi:DNA repair ATPase RecN
MKGLVEDSYREKLPDNSKKVWDTAVEEINQVAKEMNLTSEQKYALLQRSKAAVIYASLKEKSKSLPKDSEAYNENKSMMNHMSYIYRKYYKSVEDIYEKVNTRLEEIERNKNSQITNNKKK